MAVSQNPWEIGSRLLLLLITNRNWHTPLQITWKSLKLDDLESQYCIMTWIGCSASSLAVCATARTIFHRSSVRPSVCPSVTPMDQSKTVQAGITISSLSALWSLGSVKFFHINSSHFSIVTLEWSEIMDSYTSPDTAMRDGRQK